jgi:hypothetical protein
MRGVVEKALQAARCKRWKCMLQVEAHPIVAIGKVGGPRRQVS